MAVAVRGSTWDPFTTLFRQLDHVSAFPAYRLHATRPVAFAWDRDAVTKEGSDLVVTLALPGVDVDSDVEVLVTEGKLAITGKRTEYTGEFRREFAIPRDVTADRVEANYDQGLLKVRVREVVRKTPEPAKVQIRRIAPAETPAVESGTATE
ncbi:MAG TPA: Hsp20/alpha crystallin family protein [Pseudonocardiaceae bacterium]